MKISIVSPAYNVGRFLPATFESVFAQTIVDWEMVVVDDGSSDDTADVVRAYTTRDARIRLLQQPNAGVSAARNTGIAAADPTSELFIFLDCDDVWHPEALAILSASLLANPNAVAAHGLAKYIDASGAEVRLGEYEGICRNREAYVGDRIIKWPANQPTTFATLIAWNCIGNPGVVLVRRTALERVGGFDTLLKRSEDYDQWLRLSRLGDIAFVDQVLLSYRRHERNLSGDASKMRDSDVLVRAKAASDPANTPEQKRAVEAAYRAHQLNLFKDKLRLFADDLSRGRVASGLKQCAYSARHLERYVRGLPRRINKVESGS